MLYSVKFLVCLSLLDFGTLNISEKLQSTPDLQKSFKSPWQRHSYQGGRFEQPDPDGPAPRFQDTASLSNISKIC